MWSKSAFRRVFEVHFSHFEMFSRKVHYRCPFDQNVVPKCASKMCICNVPYEYYQNVHFKSTFKVHLRSDNCTWGMGSKSTFSCCTSRLNVPQKAHFRTTDRVVVLDFTSLHSCHILHLADLP